VRIQTVIKIVGPLIAIAIGAAIFIVLVKTKPKPKKTSGATLAPLVVTEKVAGGTHTVTVVARGTVIPARTVVLVPEVAGRIVSIHESLVPGGRVNEGETLVRINARDYKLSVGQQNALVEQAKFNVEVEESRKTIAEREWSLLGKDLSSSEAGRSLALREPHQRTAQAGLSSAKNSLALAQTRLSRTTIIAPFNALVREESVDVGQVVGQQTRIATLVGTDQFWVQVSVPIDDLVHLSIPGINATTGSKVLIEQEEGDLVIKRAGRVVRLLGELAPVGRLARLVVEVDDPFALKSGSGSLPLLLGAYVRVSIEGTALDNVVEVPRRGVRDGSKVWVVTKDGKLSIRTADVVWRTSTSVLVREGVKDDEDVVISSLSGVIDGMAVRREGQGKPSPKAQAKTMNKGAQ